MSDFVTHDLPVESAEGEEPLLIDANAGFYEAQPRGKSYVYVERYVQKKIFFEPLVEGTESSIRPETYLIKTTNYQDIGGGLVMFDRHYARVPDPWFDYQVVALTLAFTGGFTEGTVTINPQFDQGIKRNTSTLAKVTRRYYLESNLPTNLNFNAPQVSKPVDAVRETVVISGIIITRVVSYNPTTFIDEVIREDSVSIYQGNIYEVATFTGSFAWKGNQLVPAEFPEEVEEEEE
jgi:hypothetical protein